MFLSLLKAEALDIDWPDVYFDPSYGAAVQYSDDGIWECYHVPGKFLYVYLVKDNCIKALYGYAGIYVYPGVNQADYQQLRQEFVIAATSRGYQSEFLRRNPYQSTFEVTDMELCVTKFTYGMDMISYDLYWKTTSGNHRNMVRKAQRSNYKFTFNPVKNGDLGPKTLFRTMYANTMSHLTAADYYYFNDDYYKCLEKIAGLHLAVVFDNDTPIASGLFFVYKKYVHYHLSANTRISNCVVDFMLHEVIRYTFENFPQVKIFHLGGGLKDNDHLARFKKRICSHEYKYQMFNKSFES
jgi:hypothetical protein